VVDRVEGATEIKEHERSDMVGVSGSYKIVDAPRSQHYTAALLNGRRVVDVYTIIMAFFNMCFIRLSAWVKLRISNAECFNRLDSFPAIKNLAMLMIPLRHDRQI